MVTVGDRIKNVRKSNHLTQIDFGERIGIKGASVSMLESGKNAPSEQTLRLICREFRINYSWLITGEGEMNMSAEDDDRARLERLFDELDTSPLVRASLLALAEMPAGFVAEVEKYIRSLVEKIDKGDP